MLLTKWASKSLRVTYPWQLNQPGIDKKAIHILVRRSDIFPKTEWCMFAIQDKVIPTWNYLKCNIKDPNIVIDSCGLCSTSLETIQHVIASCPKLAQIPYKHQHEPKLSVRNYWWKNFISLRNHILHIIKMSCSSSWKMTSTNSTGIVPY